MEKNENKIVDVIATSDMHSHFLNGDYGSNIYRAGTYVNEARKNNENVILLDSGGSLAGSLAAFYYAVVAPYKRHPMIKLMNAMKYDASGISPNEFKFGLSFLTRSVALSRFPWLSANIEYTVTREPYFSTPYTIKMYSDLKIAIVGLTSDGLMKNEYAEMEEDVCIEKTLVSAKRWIRYIHEVEEP
ncbi:MAG: bifunctional metallophosphatase/5'-nucleotidase, partial [Staphylococcus epidermidis]|nr:bifunctional metallophosphatase/5'-nucleotidase [Staphylococcus epidermidis]